VNEEGDGRAAVRHPRGRDDDCRTGPGGGRSTPGRRLGEGTAELLARAGLDDDEIRAVEARATAQREAAFAVLRGDPL